MIYGDHLVWLVGGGGFATAEKENSELRNGLNAWWRLWRASSLLGRPPNSYLFFLWPNRQIRSTEQWRSLRGIEKEMVSKNALIAASLNHSSQPVYVVYSEIATSMYISEFLLFQSGIVCDGRAATYHVRFELAFFPARATMAVSGLGHERAWEIGDIYFDYDLGPVHGPRNIQVQAEKVWGSRSRSRF